jgi:hypothetical protein
MRNKIWSDRDVTFGGTGAATPLAIRTGGEGGLGPFGHGGEGGPLRPRFRLAARVVEPMPRGEPKAVKVGVWGELPPWAELKPEYFLPRLRD